MEMLKNFIQEEDGVTAVEYGLIAALIAVVIASTVQTVGTNLKAVFLSVANCLGTSHTCT